MRLHAATLLVPGYDEGIAFYVGVMGFHLASDQDQSDGKRWVLVAPEPGGPALLLARASDADQRAAIGRQAGGRVAFFLWSDDALAEHARMTAAGVAFEEEPRHEPYGVVAVWRDPWGNRWDLLGPPAP